MSSTAGKRGKRKAPSNEGKSAKATVKKPRKPKGMPDFKPGEILVDLVKKSWRLGALIGWGGFGALFYASPDTDKNVDNKATYVAKVEPHSNGPLFGELAFYQRAAKEETINKWISSHKLKFLGLPSYIGSGLHESGGTKYRFMVMERFGEDIDQIFAKYDKCFHIQTVLTLAIRIIDILEYIHEQGYVHADIKGSNLMMGYKSQRKDKVFLVDFGLAYRFNSDGGHKEYKEDPKRKHDGTIEFTSRDAHKGVAPSRRADLEILGYVMLQWLCGRLPWENNLNDKDCVMNSKIRSMDNIPQFLKTCLKDQRSDELEQYLKYIKTLEYEQIPDYNKLRKIFQDGLRKRKFPSDDGLTVKFKPGSGAKSGAASMAGGSSSDEAFHDALDDQEDEISECRISPLKPAKKRAVGRKPETQSTSKIPASPAKPTKTTSKKAASPARPAKVANKKAAASPARPTTSNKRATSPAKASPPKKRAGATKSKEPTEDPDSSEPPPKRGRGRPKATNMEEKPVAKKGRGRPKAKKVSEFVDRGTSP